ncbi:sulfotransferase family protein [Jannaschia ovalis]|uniref:Sulfotransferase n=1 Tax=Jannaschia ovalis TaxID=3038773 RepID=A0ABY8LBK9_9RHOB|nr:sulfotransferase [Jannaschia sp. GRR-S6-38]WGH78715.1 sulfotransferase [Jannaschia sp. GRR-S6-38]
MRNRIIYIAGYGRSGSTLLDMALGQHPDIFGSGEISAMCRHVWRENELCACGARIRDCTVWGPIMAAWGKSYDPEEYFALQRTIEPLLAPARIFGGGKLAAYQAQTRAMFDAIRQVSGAPVILDSSKAPGRALALARDPEVDLRVIHLVRDARAVAHAMNRAIPLDVEKGVQKKIVPRSPLRTALRWRMYNTMVERLRRSVPRDAFVRVRYEDFTRDTAGEMARIARAVDIDLAPIVAAIADGAKIAPHHQMAGSRIRMRGPVELRFDDGWTRKMSEAAQRTVVLAARRQLTDYGYLN